ncbi:DUF1289 domain-containing protein [Thalassospira lucentensis]|uniref:DUF1289 domain-containing protein n=1 Tax=Thalassospira lucentensis TaxID=168935 RepID=UPI00142D1E73|nr:DUF1289 domain-containing protein [Thalassospira lucentensis]NIZ01048.1 DUF1289 domain-containing protein [Thalassospira lucentensis]
MAVKSPCTGVCVLDAKSGFCSGCFRTGDEIGSWRDLSDGGKKRVLAQLPKRRAATKTNAKTTSERQTA